MEFITSNWAEIVTVVLAVLGAASAIAKLTPTQADDKVIAAILKVIHAVGLTKKEAIEIKDPEIK